MTNFRLSDPDIVLIHIPKTGGTSIQRLWAGQITERAFGHWLSDWDELPSIAIVRHPIDRFLSAVRMFKYGNSDLEDYYGTPRMPDLTIARALDILADDTIGFDRSIRDLKSNLKHHLLAQTHPFQCLSRAKTILRTETLTRDFTKFADTIGLNAPLPHIRETSAWNSEEAVAPSDEEMERLRSIFDEDFRQLGYDQSAISKKITIAPKNKTKTIWSEWPAFFSDRTVYAKFASDALPACTCDLALFCNETIKCSKKATWPGREKNLLKHFRSLQGEFGGLSRLSHLLACCIVTIRKTKGSGPGLELFHRILREHRALIISEVNLRWLTSICDTLVDFGCTEAQRLLALNGSLLANMTKLNETERRIFHPARPWPPNVRFQNGGELFDGVITFWTERGDMIENMFSRIESLLGVDEIAGEVVGEIAIRLTREDTVLRRLLEIADTPSKPMLNSNIRESLERIISKHL